jgi:hypothetical protein
MYLLFRPSRTFRFAEEIMMKDDDGSKMTGWGWDEGQVRQYDAKSMKSG